MGVVLYNHSDVSFRISKHDRIAQLIIERIAQPAIVVVDELDETVRAEGGFGSTGQ